MLLRYCLIYISIIILRHFLYLLYLCPSLDQGLLISYLCYLFFIFIFIFIMVNRMNADTLVLLLIFQNVSYYFYMITWMRNMNYFQLLKFSLRALLSICLFFCHFQPRVACESVAYKKKKRVENICAGISFLTASDYSGIKISERRIGKRKYKL